MSENPIGLITTVNTITEMQNSFKTTLDKVIRRLDGIDGSVPNGKAEVAEWKHFWQTPMGKKLLFTFFGVELTLLTVIVQMIFQGQINTPIFYVLVVFAVSEVKTLFNSIAELDNQNTIHQNVELTKQLNEAKSILKIAQQHQQ
jgi:hypothetical protein